MQFRPLLLAAALLAVPTVASASDSTAYEDATLTEPTALIEVEVDQRPKNLISIAPVSFLFGSLNAEYERVVADRLSLTVGAEFRWLNPEVDGSAAANTLTGMNVGAHIFLAGKAPSGLWLAPELGTWHASGSSDPGAYRGFIPRFALQLGYTGLIADILAVSVGGGVQMISFVPLPTARLSLGVAF